MFIGTGLTLFDNAVGESGGGSPPATITAPVLALAVGPTTYPPELDCSLDETVLVGDTVELQWSSVYDFASIDGTASNTIDLSEATAQAATFTGLSDISSGSHFFRARVVRGSSQSAWSNTVNHGDVVAPTFTSSASPSVAELTVNPTGVLTFDEPVALIEISGGADSALFSLTGANWTLNTTPDYETKTSYVVQFRATDYAGNSTTQTMTLTITDVDETPNAFSFTDQTGVNQSTVTVSDQITVAGLAVGVSVPVTVSGGEYRKNGGTWTTTAGTVANGDVIDLRVTSSASYLTAVSVTLSINGVSDTFTVTTKADPALPSVTASSTAAYVAPTGTFISSRVQAVSVSTGYTLIAIQSGRRITGVTGDSGVGAAALIYANFGTGTSTNWHLSMWLVATPSAGTVNFTITSEGNIDNFSMRGFNISGTFNATPTATYNLAPAFGRATITFSGAMTVPIFGIVVAQSLNGAMTTWTGATEIARWDAVIGNQVAVAVVTASVNPAVGRTASGDTSSMIGAAWGS